MDVAVHGWMWLGVDVCGLVGDGAYGLAGVGVYGLAG